MRFFSLLALLPFGFFGFEAGDLPVPAGPLHGIYMTSQTVASARGDALADEFIKLGGNMIVFDIQDTNGKLAYPSQLRISTEIGNRKDQIPDLTALVARLHEKGIYVVARFVLFKNGFLAGKKPEWTLKNKQTKRPFVSRDGPIWLDPGNPELKEYLFDISRELVFAGVDEIQFDYVRFPEGGRGGNIGYSFTGDNKLTRDQSITNFVAEIAEKIHFIGRRVSVDVFGIVVWDNVSWKVIGQNIRELAKHVDAIYPMPYPSHFGPGWGGHRNPADEPYFFVQETSKKFVEQTAGTGVKIRPWLQGFAMRVSRYGPKYVGEQIRALTDIGVDEWTVWNARNVYDITFKALK